MSSASSLDERLLYCKDCDEEYIEGSRHKATAKHLQNVFSSGEPIKQVETAFKNRLQTYFIRNLDETQLDLEIYLKESVGPIILKQIRDVLLQQACLKVNIVVYLLFKKPEQDSESVEKQLVTFKTTNIPIYRETKVNEKTLQIFESILKENSDFHMKGSGWTLDKILGTELRINKYDALSRGSSYIPLPFTTTAVVNVRNEDHECFRYAVLGKHLPSTTHDKNRVSQYYPYFDKYDFSCVNFPTPLRDIPTFEEKNNVSISVFGIEGYDDEESEDDENEGRDDNMEIGFGPEDYIQCGIDEENDVDEPDDLFLEEAAESGLPPPKKKKGKSKKVKKGKLKIYPLKVAKNEKPDHIDLLYYTKGQKSHYCWISNFAKLVRSQLTRYEHPIYICKKCFNYYLTEDKLVEHRTFCSKISSDDFRVELPKNPIMKFRNIRKCLTHNYVAYCDFESYLEETEFDPELKTYAYQHHRPMSYAYTVVSSDPEINTDQPVLYRGEKAHQHFLDAMIDLTYRIEQRIQVERTIRMSPEAEATFEAATVCELCDDEFSETNPKVRDHTHQYVNPELSNFRMALCRNCNLNFKHPKSLICVFHNLDYDLHLIMKGLSGRNIRAHIVPLTDETYISLTLRVRNGFSIRFIDSYRFLAASLAKLVSTLPDSAFIRTKRLCDTDQQLELVKKKGVFCYDYVTNEQILNETTEPPPKEAFFSLLQNEPLPDEDYQRFLDTWNAFGFINLGEYSDFYLRLDVCLLADVFEEFRRFGRKNYKLDCANYLTLPAFAFDAFLKMTKAEIQRFQNYDMLLMIHNNIRGGITQCSLRHAVANNPQIPETYDHKEPTNYVQYLDVTALYAHTMCKPLPYKDYMMVHEDDLEKLSQSLLSIPDDGEIGFILEVDLDYPDHLHDHHSDLPFCLEKKIPPMLGAKHPKLLATLEPKEKYVIHFVALKQAINHGLVLKKIHRALQFKQRPFLKDFIELNAKLRKEAKGNEFHQALLKLCSNACYGKFLENPLKRKKISLATSTKQIQKHIAKAEFIDRTIFDEQLAASRFSRKKILFDRPEIVGFAILELSKCHMYDFHYNFMLKKYPRDKVQIVYMDTDSYIYNITTPQLYEDMLSDLEKYDTSNFPENHRCRSDFNYKKMGTFRDETGGDPIIEAVCLRPKSYMYQTQSKMDKRAKGVQRSVLKNTITADDYRFALYKNRDVYRVMRNIRSVKHEISTYRTEKKALSSFDDKRFVLQGNVVSLPYGHYRLRQRKIQMEKIKTLLENFDHSSLKTSREGSSHTFRQQLELKDAQRLSHFKSEYVRNKL